MSKQKTQPCPECGGEMRYEKHADEVTYPLHVILRYKLEKAIIANELDTDDLPGAWNDLMEKLVGIRPKNDTDGVMQDVHWSEGLFGYFPTYTLGNLYSAAIRDAMAAKDAAR